MTPRLRHRSLKEEGRSHVASAILLEARGVDFVRAASWGLKGGTAPSVDQWAPEKVWMLLIDWHQYAI